MRKYKKAIIVCGLIVYTFLCTSCWDGVEINRRSVIFSLGIDKNMDANNATEDQQPKRYIVTYTIPDMSKLSGSDSIVENIIDIESVKSTTVTTSIEEVQTRTQNTINFGHTKAILLGADLLQDEHMMREVIDSIERNMVFARSIPIFAVRGTAEEVTYVKNDQNPILGLYIMNYINNKERAKSRYREALVGTFIRDMRENNAAIIPIVETIENKKIEIKGGALIKDFRLKTWFTPEEVRGILWVEGKVKGAQIPIPTEGGYLSYTVRDQNSKITFSHENGEIHCRVDITNQGDIREYYIYSKESLTDLNYIQQLENEISQRITKEVIHLLNQTKQYNTDIIGFGTELYRQNPSWWNEVKDNWEEVYHQMSIEVYVDTKIRRTGIIE